MSGGPNLFSLPKAGNREADYEDAFAISEHGIAIADGATESSFARAWAEALAQGFADAAMAEEEDPHEADRADVVDAGAPPDEEGTDNVACSADDGVADGIAVETRGATDPDAGASAPAEYAVASADPNGDAGAAGDNGVPWDADAIRQRVTPLQRAWHDSIAWDHLPWFAEGKARAGAFAALLAFRLGLAAPPSQSDDAPRAERRWHAFAIGDCCMFQVRDDALLAAFPLEAAEQFNSRPLLLSSNPANNKTVWDAIAFREGECIPGDLFLFATDALAHWFLTEAEAGRQPWQTLAGLRSQDEFARLVEKLRRSHLLRNDDVTLVRLLVPGDEVDLTPQPPPPIPSLRSEERGRLDCSLGSHSPSEPKRAGYPRSGWRRGGGGVRSRQPGDEASG